MNLQQYTKIIDGKEIHYFVNEKGANIEVERIEPNTFNWWVVYCTVDLYINIYNDDFTRKVSFLVENFSTGIEGGSWFEGEEEDDEEYKEELIPQISDILTGFFECKQKTISGICSLIKDADREAVIDILENYEDDPNPKLGDIVQEFIDELSGDEGNEDEPECLEQLSKLLEDFFNCKKKSVADICALAEGVNKKAILEDFEIYEGVPEDGEELDIEHIAGIIADDMPSKYPEPTEEDSWEQTLDYLDPSDPYGAWEGYKDFWNSFNKYNEEFDEEPELMFASMINDEDLKKWCSTRFSEEDRAVFDFEIIKPEVDYDWEGEYKDKKERYVERPVFVSLNNLGTERKVLRNILIDNYFVNECLEMTSCNWFLNNNEDADFEKLNIFVGEWLVDSWGCARAGRLIGDYLYGGYDLPEWEDDNTVHLLRFWKLTDVKHKEFNKKSYTAFYSGQRCWLIDDDLEGREKDFYPVFFSYVGDLPNVEERIAGRVCIPGEESVSVTFSIELTAIESRIIEYYYEHEKDMKYLPQELYSKLVSHLQKAYLDSVKDSPNAIRSLEDLDASGCSYHFPDMEDEDEE